MSTTFTIRTEQVSTATDAHHLGHGQKDTYRRRDSAAVGWESCNLQTFIAVLAPYPFAPNVGTTFITKWKAQRSGNALRAERSGREDHRQDEAVQKVQLWTPLLLDDAGFEHLRAVLKSGGYLQYLASIAYRSFALALTSPQIADLMGIKPTTVRIQIARMRDVARYLGYDTGRPGSNFKGGEMVLRHWRNRDRRIRDRKILGKEEPTMAKKKSRFLNSARVKMLYRELGTVPAVARRIGSTPTGVRRNLRRNGVKA